MVTFWRLPDRMPVTAHSDCATLVLAGAVALLWRVPCHSPSDSVLACTAQDDRVALDKVIRLPGIRRHADIQRVIR